MRRAILIYNPKSGRQVAMRTLPKILEALHAAEFDVEPMATEGPGDATRLARQAVEKASAEVTFAMGGDGTLRETARGLLGSEVALAPLPAGTTNVLAIALGLPGRALDAARVMAHCRPRAFDVGLAGDEPFLMQVSGGLDAAVMARQNSAAKKQFGKAAVAWTGVGQWWAYDYPRIELRADGQTLSPEGVSHFAVCNIAYYAGAFQMAPSADPGDGRLDLVTFHGRGRFATLGFARDLALGRHLKRADVETRHVESLEIVGPVECPLQIDGDVLKAARPVEISLSRDPLRVLAPAVRD